MILYTLHYHGWKLLSTVVEKITTMMMIVLIMGWGCIHKDVLCTCCSHPWLQRESCCKAVASLTWLLFSLHITFYFSSALQLFRQSYQTWSMILPLPFYQPKTFRSRMDPRVAVEKAAPLISHRSYPYISLYPTNFFFRDVCFLIYQQKIEFSSSDTFAIRYSIFEEKWYMAFAEHIITLSDLPRAGSFIYRVSVTDWFKINRYLFCY